MSEELAAEVLLARVARNDVDALSVLYDRYAPLLYGLATRVVPSRAAAEETLLEIFLRLRNESARLSEAGVSVAAWLVVTGRETAMGRLRVLRSPASSAGPLGRGVKTGKGSDARPTDEGGFLPLNMARLTWLPRPEEITLIDERLVLLHKVIDQLPKPQRRALELTVFGCLNETEIATEMGEPLGKVRTSLRAAVTFVKHRRRAVCGTWAANI